jgi:hypothetical protein
VIGLIHFVRVLCGAFLLLNGLNMWFGFLPISHPTEGPAYILMSGLVGSGLFSWVKYIEVIVGIALMLNVFVPLALVLIAPLVVVILYVDFALLGTTQSVIFGVVMLFLWLVPVYGYLSYYLRMLTFRAKPKIVSSKELDGIFSVRHPSEAGDDPI